MLKQNLKIAYRNIKKNRLYSFINIAGLACGLSAAFIILLFVTHELSYDKFQKNYRDIYIAYHNYYKGEGHNANCPFIFRDMLNTAPGIRKTAQVSGTWEDSYIIENNNFIKKENVFFADPEIFDILTFNFISGSPKNFSSDINSVFISEKTFNKYFSVKAVGGVIELQSGTKKYLLKIAGIFEDVPSASSFHPDIIMNMSIMRKENEDALNDWGFNCAYTYVLLGRGASVSTTLEEINEIIKRNTPEQFQDKYNLIALADLHLNDIGLSIGKTGSLSKVYIFSGIGVIILLMACFNFINISSAGAAARAKEIGVRKTIGARRSSLISQLLVESMSIAFTAFPIAILLTEIFTPIAGEFFDREIEINYLSHRLYIAGGILIVLLTGLLSGGYYAFAASKFNPVEALSNKIKFSSVKSPFRKTLITFQFVIFSGMIVCSVIMYNQMKYLNDMDLGYKKENLVNLKIPHGIEAKEETFKEILKKVPGVNNVTLNSTVPPMLGNGLISFESIPGGETYTINKIFCDGDYKSVLGLKMAKGEFFNNSDFETRNSDKIVLTETAAKLFGIDSPGYMQSRTGEIWHVAGIAKDFNINDLYGAMGPIILEAKNKYLRNYTISIDGKNVPQTMEKLQENWSGFYSDVPFEYKFLDEEYDARYRADERFSSMINFFTAIAAFIAVIGLFGVSSYSASQRVKEIGIRKVFGASMRQVMLLLNKEIILISIIGSVISFPLAYYLINKWLDTFAYKVSVNFGDFFLTFIISLLIGLASVSFQAFKAAAANPIESIRAE